MSSKSRRKPGGAATQSRATRRAKSNDDRGRRVGTKVRDYERMCSAGSDRLAQTLISRHNMRMENTTRVPDRLRVEAIEMLAPVVALDAAHRTLGLTLNRAPSAFHGEWPRDLGWGVDSCVAASRLLQAGQVVAAATVARQQLERWTFVMAPVVDVEKGVNEDVMDFMAKAWTAYAHRGHGFVPNPDSMLKNDAVSARSGEPAGNGDEDGTVGTEEPVDTHEHVFLSDGREVCPAVVYGVLSEFMHARLCEDSLWWESVELLNRFRVPDVSFGAVQAVGDALSLSLIQIRYLTAAALAGAGDEDLASGLVDRDVWFDRYSPRVPVSEPVLGDMASPYPSSFSLPTLPAIMPLSPREGLSVVVRQYLSRERAKYDSVFTGGRPEGRLYRDDELTTLAFTAHRDASARYAQAALDVEQDQLGGVFNIDTLTSRGTGYVLVGELAAIAAMWARQSPDLQPVSASLALVSSTLRSAYWLWLEEDDRAMASLRCTLEQLARARAYRTKPVKAADLEASAYNRPQRWLEVAGWKRLSTLNRALGEYAHARREPNWEGARELLKELQLDSDGPNALQTARGHALDLVATLAARETISVLNQFSEMVARTASDLVENHLGLSLTDSTLEAILNNSYAHRLTPIERSAQS